MVEPTWKDLEFGILWRFDLVGPTLHHCGWSKHPVYSALDICGLESLEWKDWFVDRTKLQPKIECLHSGKSSTVAIKIVAFPSYLKEARGLRHAAEQPRLVDVATGHELKLFDGHKESCARRCHGCVAMVQSWCILLHCILSVSASYQMHIQHFFTQDYVTCLDLHWPKEVVSAAAETWLARWS